MDEEIKAYIEFISKIHEIKRPKMPKFDIKSYTDNEYLLAIHEIMTDFKFVDFTSY